MGVVAYWVLKLVIGPLLWLLTRPTVVGRRHVPARGPVVLAANHRSVVDSFLLCLVLRRRVTFVAKREYFTGRGPRGVLRRWFFRVAGQVPVDRSGAGSGNPALAAAGRLLSQGKVWGIHPEGTRSPDGAVHRGRTGVMRVALGRNVPVVPVILQGTENVHRRGARWWRPARVTITFLPPMDLTPWRSRPDDRAAVREATDTLMHHLARMSGQRYVDRYADAADRPPQ